MRQSVRLHSLCKTAFNVNIPGYKYAIVNAVIHTFTYLMQKHMLMLIVSNINTPM